MTSCFPSGRAANKASGRVAAITSSRQILAICQGVLGKGVRQVAANEIQVPSFAMPRVSSLLRNPRQEAATAASPPPAKAAKSGAAPSVPPPPPYLDSDAASVFAYREWIDTYFYPRILATQRKTFNVTIEPQVLAGVPVEVIAPADGVAPEWEGRVLVNLHAGGITFGARLCGQLESVPVAALARCKVVSVDYRLAPEHRHPAAAEDVEAVLSALADIYGVGSIGLYGYSAGALLATQAIYRLQQARKPLPGALALLFGGASYWGEGDSSTWAPAISGRSMPPWEEHLYFLGLDGQDPAVFPIRSEESLRAFPPSLLMSGSRDFALSSVVHMHSRLVKLGVPTQLNVWEGVAHAFSHDFRLPQSAELFDTLIDFFDKRLNRTKAA